MLNVFYWYATIWSVVLMLYLMGWSNLCKPLDVSVIFFFVMSIFICLIVGIKNRHFFEYTSLQNEERPKHNLVYVILVIGIIEFIYSKDIPLISILMGRSLYGDFRGIPIVHTLLENMICFYSTYMFYLYIEVKKRAYLLKAMLPVGVLLLMFHKGAISFCLFTMFVIGMAKARTKYKKLFNIKNIIIVNLLIICLIYINGGLTNIRSGVSWNDLMLAKNVGRINDKWPKWIPMQFGWAYTYLISPLSNLNYNIYLGVKKHFSGGIIAIMPDYLTKRLFSGIIVDSPKLYSPVLNACTGFIEAVISLGTFGLWFYFFSFMFIVVFLLHFRASYNENYRVVVMALLCMMTVILFFYNTLRAAATSFIPFFILVFPLLKKVKIYHRGRRIL